MKIDLVAWYKQILAHIWNSRRYILLALILYAACLGIGVLFTHVMPTTSQNIVKIYAEQADSGDGGAPQANVQTFWYIFVHNAEIDSATVLLGCLLGFFPALVIVVNGILVSIVVVSAGAKAGILSVILVLLPHGIIEIPTQLISVGLGIKYGMQMIRKCLGAKDVGLVRETLLNIGACIGVIIPLLFIAAFIETFISYYVAQALLH